MQNWCLTVARLVLTFWVGAATLFVVVVVRVNHFMELDSIMRGQLIVIRFPAYYAFGFSCVITGLVTTIAASNHAAVSRRRMVIAAAFTAVALATMVADYAFIYSPLYEMVVSADALPSSFRSYHEASKYVNLFDVGLCLVAAVMLCHSRRAGDAG